MDAVAEPQRAEDAARLEPWVAQRVAAGAGVSGGANPRVPLGDTQLANAFTKERESQQTMFNVLSIQNAPPMFGQLF